MNPISAITPAVQQASHGPLGAVGMVVLLTIVTLLPAVVLSCTCFVRFIVVFGFVRTGLGTPSAPPNQILVGLSLFMAIFVSAPVGAEIYDTAGRAYLAGQMSEGQALDAATPPLRQLPAPSHDRSRPVAVLRGRARAPRPASIDEVPLRIALPAFVLSELRCPRSRSA